MAQTEQIVDTDYLVTDSLNMAAFFVAMGHEVERFDWSGQHGKGCHMRFTCTPELSRAHREWRDGEATVNARKYGAAIGALKRELIETRPPTNQR